MERTRQNLIIIVVSDPKNCQLVIVVTNMAATIFTIIFTITAYFLPHMVTAIEEANLGARISGNQIGEFLQASVSKTQSTAVAYDPFLYNRNLCPPVGSYNFGQSYVVPGKVPGVSFMTHTSYDMSVKYGTRRLNEQQSYGFSQMYSFNSPQQTPHHSYNPQTSFKNIYPPYCFEKKKPIMSRSHSPIASSSTDAPKSTPSQTSSLAPTPSTPIIKPTIEPTIKPTIPGTSTLTMSMKITLGGLSVAEFNANTADFIAAIKATSPDIASVELGPVTVASLAAHMAQVGKFEVVGSTSSISVPVTANVNVAPGQSAAATFSSVSAQLSSPALTSNLQSQGGAFAAVSVAATINPTYSVKIAPTGAPSTAPTPQPTLATSSAKPKASSSPKSSSSGAAIGGGVGGGVAALIAIGVIYYFRSTNKVDDSVNRVVAVSPAPGNSNVRF